MTIIADDAYKNRKDKLERIHLFSKATDFNGVVMYHTMKGYFLNGFKYKNGRIIGTISVNGTQRISAKSLKGTSINTEYECTAYAWDVTTPGNCQGSGVAGLGVVCPSTTKHYVLLVCDPTLPIPYPEDPPPSSSGSNDISPEETGGGYNDGPADPCSNTNPDGSSTSDNGGTGVPCEENTSNNPPQFNPNEPFYISDDVEFPVESDWYLKEDFYALINVELSGQDIPKSNPIPEAYYKGDIEIDMTTAFPKEGRTYFDAPRNRKYFWTKVAELRPYYFDESNRALIKLGKAPIINEQWLKYHNTHIAYEGGKLIHHHLNQGKMAVAVPEKVHHKWNSIFHTKRNAGLINSLGGKMGMLANVTQILTILVDIQTGNPDSWVNWFDVARKVGKLYYDPQKDIYFEIIKIEELKDPSGNVINAKFYYTTYGASVWDDDEKKYMGVFKIGKFVEEYNPQTNTSRNIFQVPMGD